MSRKKATFAIGAPLALLLTLSPMVGVASSTMVAQASTIGFTTTNDGISSTNSSLTATATELVAAHSALAAYTVKGTTSSLTGLAAVDNARAALEALLPSDWYTILYPSATVSYANLTTQERAAVGLYAQAMSKILSVAYYNDGTSSTTTTYTDLQSSIDTATNDIIAAANYLVSNTQPTVGGPFANVTQTELNAAKSLTPQDILAFLEDFKTQLKNQMFSLLSGTSVTTVMNNALTQAATDNPSFSNGVLSAFGLHISDLPVIKAAVDAKVDPNGYARQSLLSPAVIYAVYNAGSSTSTGGGSGTGTGTGSTGSGGTITVTNPGQSVVLAPPITVNTNGVATVTIQAGDITKALAGGSNGADVVIDLTKSTTPSVQLNLSLDAVTAAAGNGGTNIAVATPSGTLQVPLQALNSSAIAASLGLSSVNASNVTVQVTVQPASTAVVNAAKNVADDSGATLESPLVDFMITLLNGNTSAELRDTAETYLIHEVTLNNTADPAHMAGVRVLTAANGDVSFVPVPTIFNGMTASMERPGNSVYAVVNNNVMFNDIASSWAKDDITLLANKLIVNGIGNEQFAPTGDVTRAQYAAMLVRALGLDASNTSSAFTDVSSTAWYAGAVNAASTAGIIHGESATSFAPDALITRQEAAVMLYNALTFLKGSAAANAQANVSAFSDGSQVASWAVNAVGTMTADGVINGFSSDNGFHPTDNATREQTAKLFVKFLEMEKLISQ